MNRQHGFTLIELMITLGIAAILLTVAVPSFNTTIKNNRLVTHANLLVSSIGLARSEAVKHGRTATVCVSSDQATCTAETNWELGWMVWVDLNTNNQPDAGEERKFVHPFRRVPPLPAPSHCSIFQRREPQQMSPLRPRHWICAITAQGKPAVKSVFPLPVAPAPPATSSRHARNAD